MHEYSITCSIMKILEKLVSERKLSKISRIDFEINPLSSIEPDSIKFYYEFLTRENKILKNARLKFNKVKLEIQCSKCTFNFKTGNFPIRCPRCSSFNIYKGNVEDIRIKSMHASSSIK